MPTGRQQYGLHTKNLEPGQRSHGPRSASGFTYLGILIAVAIIGVGLAETGVIWYTTQQRNQERELLFIGDQFRSAIGHYFNASAQYPSSLEDLLRDPHQPGVVRYLRKIYYDPITGTQDWGLVKNVNNRIIGVYSQSQQRPIKQSNFSEVDQDFDGQDAYSKWTFIYQPRLRRINTIPRSNTLPPANTTLNGHSVAPAAPLPSFPSGRNQ